MPPDLTSARQRVEQQIQQGVASLQAGRLDDATGYLRKAIESEPRHALAHNCLGIIFRAKGETERAIECYEQAIKAAPEYAEAYNNLGIAHESRGDNARAISSYEHALRHKPGFAAAHNNLGNALTKEGRLREAVKSFDEALSYQPQFPAALNNRGIALRDLGEREEAEASFRRALSISPRFGEAFANLGNVLRDKGATAAALECFDEAIQYKRELAPAHVSLGDCYRELGKFAEAATAYTSALEIAPEHPQAWFGLGTAQKELGRLEESATSFSNAVRAKPDYVAALNSLSDVLAIQRRLDEAIAALVQAVRIAPDELPLYNNLGNLYRSQDRLPEAAASYSEILRRRPNTPLASLRLSTLCPAVFESRDQMEEYYEKAMNEWSSMKSAASYSDLSDLMGMANEPPYNMQFSGENIRDLKRSYAEIFEYRGPEVDVATEGDPIRIGCVVTERHELAFLRLIWGALSRMNRDEFRLSIVCAPSAAAKFQATIRDPQVDILPLPDHDGMVEAVRAARFDILYYFEIGTDSFNYFLPFFRLAPAQCTSWGIQVTSGVKNVDYYLSSSLVEPHDADEHYTEQLVRANTLLSYQKQIELPPNPRGRESFGFSAQQHIYLCAQHIGKFHTDFDQLLGDILRRDPQGIVVITQDLYGYGGKRLADRLDRTIADVSSRVIQLGRQGLPDYLSLLSVADVLLDAPHFGGVNSTYDALSLNRPIVCLPSRFHRGRYTMGCYQRMELLDCVANSAAEYVEIATRLGQDANHRNEIRERIRMAKHLVFEDDAAVGEHERIFRQLAERTRAA